MSIVSLLLLIGSLHAATLDEYGIPDWILPGILMVETRSTYLADGSISYSDRRRGSAGELGCFQITYAAFASVALAGERFVDISDPAKCERVAARYLHYLHRRYGSWTAAVMAYNAGKPGTKAGRRYLNKVYRAMGMNQ